jgi:hypothetical protein
MGGETTRTILARASIGRGEVTGSEQQRSRWTFNHLYLVPWALHQHGGQSPSPLHADIHHEQNPGYGRNAVPDADQKSRWEGLIAVANCKSSGRKRQLHITNRPRRQILLPRSCPMPRNWGTFVHQHGRCGYSGSALKWSRLHLDSSGKKDRCATSPIEQLQNRVRPGELTC